MRLPFVCGAPVSVVAVFSASIVFLVAAFLIERVARVTPTRLAQA